MGDRDYPKIKRGSVWNDNNALMMLLLLNGLGFVILYFIKSIYSLSQLSEESWVKNIYAWFTVPASPAKFITRPWTLVTAPFSQIALLLVISGIFWLWTFGRIFHDLTGNRRIVPLYLYGGIAAAVTYLLVNGIFPSLQQEGGIITGSAASIVSIAIATTILSPQYRFFPMIAGGIPLWVITMIFILVDLSSLSGSTPHIAAHVAAGLVGYGFAAALNRGRDWSEWLSNLYDRFTNVFEPGQPVRARRRVKEEVFYDTRGKKPYVKTTNLTQQKVDEILDKINQKGYDRLTDEEKDLLRRASEEDL
jgi:membrane associated rhomboid family serine protease